MKHRETEDGMKMNRASVTCGTIPSIHEFGVEGKSGEEGDREKFEKTMA